MFLSVVLYSEISLKSRNGSKLKSKQKFTAFYGVCSIPRSMRGSCVSNMRPVHRGNLQKEDAFGDGEALLLKTRQSIQISVRQ